MGYPAERKESVLKKMLPPSNKTIKELAREEGISKGTLHNWRKSARAEAKVDYCRMVIVRRKAGCLQTSFPQL